MSLQSGRAKSALSREIPDVIEADDRGITSPTDKKRTGFRRSELKGGNHEKVHSGVSNDANHDLFRAKSRRHNARPRKANRLNG